MSTYDVGFRVMAPLGFGEGRRKQTSGRLWTEFNKDKETITLKGLTGKVTVTAQC